MPLLLAGCWDEQNYNTTIHVPMAGITGDLEDLQVNFGLPAIERKTDESRVITVTGRSFLDAKSAADAATHNQLNTSMLTALLISEDSAKTNLYGYLDGFYRDVRNRLGMTVIITEGITNPYIEKGAEFGDNINTFYSEMTTHLHENSQLPHMDLQHACTYLFDEAVDLQLPYMKMNAENFPEITGVGMFDGHQFTGEIIPMKEMVLMQLLKDELGKTATDVVIYEDSALGYEIEKMNRKVKVHPGSVDLFYQVDISIQDFFPDRVKQRERRKDIEEAVKKDLSLRASTIFQQMKSVNHDGLGIGRYYRAFQPEIYKQKSWKETYQNLQITIHVDVNVRDSGIMD